MKDTKKIVMMGLFVSMALALHIFEKAIPVPFITPGAKLGLSNIITLTVLMYLGFKDAFTVLVARIILGSIFGGGLSGFIYSISGGLLSILVMALIKRLGKENVSVIGISVAGAVFHNIGQLLAAAFIINNINIFTYLPILFIAAVGTGVFVGLVAKYLLASLDKIVNIY
ncbi:Gx transporter family protein [Paramaledivibacter caminithermalis]|jgi:heptaprenyl diphosphate synthase|uniref:Heptaprenyl diphosphate synthase n=1 Tax=Paramaledivibacter caminithermalis (strain DSM 15212 / CIP 107654 / DViRD3) TaxID=1121301 RepID=A0A1M6LEJ9_PARC5|nr:Gx transporter family protein [Paramaledivibacter caminithermalis]SHJ69624.1 heptaprenyl diphosphate synthase [Paramaledivibacter caminithermalis DSM 15212]